MSEFLRANFKCHLCLCLATLALWLAYNGEKGKALFANELQ